MSALSTTNGETAREMLKRALVAKGTADWNGRQEPEYREFACRNYVHTAELALKAVYVKHEQPFERTPNIAELYESCPEPSRPDGGFDSAVLQDFSVWYPGPYFIERHANRQDLNNCQEMAGQLVEWARRILHDQ